MNLLSESVKSYTDIYDDGYTDYNTSYNGDYNDDYNTTNKEISPLPSLPPAQWVAMVLYFIVFILGVPGNMLVIWTTTFKMKITVNTVWFLNLAVADLLCCLSLPFNIMGLVLGYWPLGLFACKFLFSILLVTMYASVLLLTMISIDRCALVMKPVWCQNKRTVRKAQVACLVIWILAVVLSSPSFIFRDVQTKINRREVCTYNYKLLGGHQETVEANIAIFRLLLGFIIPLLVITVCYSMLLGRVNEKFTQSKKTMKVVVLVIIGFFVCWLPYHVAGLILALNPSNTPIFKSTIKVDPILIALAFINSCINPIIYVLVGRDFKSKFKRTLSVILRNVLADEMSQSDSKKSKASTLLTRNTEASV